MNERIRELLEKATVDALFETRDAVDLLDNPVTKQQRQLQLEKFAELIVRECANQLPRISEDYYTGDGIVEDAQKLILEHFGVES